SVLRLERRNRSTVIWSADSSPVTWTGGEMMRVYIGIDWSEQKHDVTLLNHNGAILEHFCMAHTPDGLLKLEDACQQFGLPPQACLVGLETAHHLLIDFLWDRGYEQVYVIPPSVIKSSRGRYGQ